MALKKTYSWKMLVFGLTMLLFCPLSRECSAAFTEKITVRYSHGFSVEYRDNVTLIKVTNPWPGASTSFQYLLKPRGMVTPGGYEGYQIIETPVESMVALSSTQLAFIDQLGLVDRLVGFSDPARAHTSSVRAAARQGRLRAVGQNSTLQIETVLDLSPEVIFTYGTGSFRDAYPKLLEAGLKVGMIGEYMESTPLGRAEWIKFVALFFNREQEAEKIFSQIETRYLQLAALTRELTERPTVITNTPYGGHWSIAGGNSFTSHFIQDAGATYVWRETGDTGSIPMDIELVYDRGLSADFWINTGIWTSLSQATHSDPRFSAFKSLQTAKLFNNNKRVNAAGGNDFWESGMVQPDVILADLIHIFHPELLPDHDLFYYRQLK